MKNTVSKGDLAPIDAARVGIDPSQIGGEIEVADTLKDIAEGIDSSLLPDQIAPAEIDARLLPDPITPAE